MDEKARAIGRDEGVAWAVSQMVQMAGTDTHVMELARAWGMEHLLAVADSTDLPHLKKLIKDWPKYFYSYRAYHRRAKAKGGDR